MNIKVVTLGCKVNQYESEAIITNMIENGFELCPENDNADITIINSCCVTSVSEQKAIKLMHRIKRENPTGIIVLTGCMPQAFPDADDRYSEADIIMGNTKRQAILPAVNQYLMTNNRIIDIPEHKKGEEFEKININQFHNRTRAFVKIQDGCDRFCTYCIIPYARGRVRSKHISDIKTEIQLLANNGFKEIVLVGINLTSFGKDTGENFCDAVEAVCNIEGIERVRLGSLEPECMDYDVLIRLSKLKEFCPQFHLSLQSGCDETLKRMNRHYTSNEYLEIVNNIRSIFVNPSITTDIMVGFPKETEEEFSKNVEFAKKVGFAKAHIFAYSRRKGTPADKSQGQLTNAVKKQRSDIMINVCEQKRKEFLNSQLGLVESVLFETKCKDDIWEGYTKNYTPVRLKSSEDISGKILGVKLVSLGEDWCNAEKI